MLSSFRVANRSCVHSPHCFPRKLDTSYVVAAAELQPKVNDIVRLLLTEVDRDGSKTLEPRELRAAMASLKGRRDRPALMGCALLAYVAAAQQALARNAKLLETMAACKPAVVAWDKDPRVARLQAIICFYVAKGVSQKITDELARYAREEAAAYIKEEVIGPIIEEAMTEAFGEVIAGVVMAVMF